MMKKLLVAAALSALCASAAVAQDHHDRGGDPGRGSPGPGGEHHNAAPAAPAPQPQAEHRGEPNGGARPAAERHDRPAQPNRGADNNRPNFNRPDNRPAFNPPNNRPGPNRPAANNGPRRDFSSFHRNFTAPRRYHAPTTYRRPAGFYAHRWTYGERLPAAFWARDYWLNDFVDFGLMSPPPGTTWVRYGNDALLIDEYSGEVIQVEYNVFY